MGNIFDYETEDDTDESTALLDDDDLEEDEDESGGGEPAAFSKEWYAKPEGDGIEEPKSDEGKGAEALSKDFYKPDELDDDSEVTGPEDYKFERSGLPEDMDYDEEMETQFRWWAFGADLSRSVATRMYKKYNEMMLGRHEAAKEIEEQALESLKWEFGNEADVKLGDDENIGTIHQGLLDISKELGMDYYDDEDILRSTLIDDLELDRKDGALGNKPSIIRALDYLLNLRHSKARKGSKNPKAFSDDFYNDD